MRENLTGPATEVNGTPSNQLCSSVAPYLLDFVLIQQSPDFLILKQ